MCPKTRLYSVFSSLLIFCEHVLIIQKFKPISVLHWTLQWQWVHTGGTCGKILLFLIYIIYFSLFFFIVFRLFVYFSLVFINFILVFSKLIWLNLVIRLFFSIKTLIVRYIIFDNYDWSEYHLPKWRLN